MISEIRCMEKSVRDARREGRDVYEVMMDEMPDSTEGLYYLPHLAGTERRR